MAVARPTYCTREMVKRALDIHETARNNVKVDRAIEAAADNTDGILHRRFWIEDTTCYWDWPNFQRSFPWRVWFDENELADTTVNVPVVTSGGNVIPAGDIFWGPWNYSPPFTYLELNRSSSASFGQGATPQKDVAIAGTYGYWTRTDTIGTLTSGAGSADATVVVSDGSVAGTGSFLIVGTERMLVTNVTSAGTGQAIAATGTGLTTNSAADDTTTVADGAALNPDEILLVDSERMLVLDVTGNQVIVKRAWDGTRLAAHQAGAGIYAYRTLAVTRGAYGSTAASHSTGATVNVLRIPSLIRDLNVAEALVQVLQETGGYTDPQGEAAAAVANIGAGLPDKWDEAETRYGRKARLGVI
jgi:hypothetical protein